MEKTEQTQLHMDESKPRLEMNERVGIVEAILFVTGNAVEKKEICRAMELTEGELYRTEKKTVQVSGERLDAVIAKVFSLSREEAQSLFKKRLVFADGRQIDSPSYSPKENEKISVRGHGRFIYRGCQSYSKKGKMNTLVELYL